MSQSLSRSSLVFAAENISLPSSMMGHVFLKIEGTNSRNIYVQHMISFFTEIRDLNIPKLIWESLITGKPGYYTLTPYEENKAYYLYEEQRSIWEYELELNQEHKILLHYYLYELQKIELNYYFHSFNCATVVRNILAIAWPEIVDQAIWTTPLDVVRLIDDQKKVSLKKFIPSTQWKIKAIYGQLKPRKKDLADLKKRNYVDFGYKGSDEEKWLFYDLASAYNDYQLQGGHIKKEEWREYRSFLNNKKENVLPNAEVSVSEGTQPSQTHPDSQVFLKYQNDSQSNLYVIGFLPTAHSLFDDDSQYLNRWELKLGEFSLGIDQEKRKFFVNSFLLYSAISLSPTDDLFPTWSGLLRIGFEPRIDQDLVQKRTGFAEAGFGKTTRLSEAIDVHALLVGGYHLDLEPKSFFGPQLGIRVAEKRGWQTNLVLNFRISLESQFLTDINLSQIYNSKKYSLVMSLSNFGVNTQISRGEYNQQSSLSILGKWFF